MRRFVMTLTLLTLMLPMAHPRAQGARALAVAGRSSAHPSVATLGSFAAVVWAASLPDGTTDIYAAVSRDGGATFSTPVRVNSTPGDARVNGEQPPRVSLSAVANAPLVNVVWTSKNDKGSTLLFSRSSDGGRTFAAATPVPGSEAAGNRGWENMSTDRAGNTRVVWLDHRDMAAPAGQMAGHVHAGHDASDTAKKDGAAEAQKSKLYLARIGDSKATVVTAGVCYCCKTAIVSGADGALFMAWRHVYPGNLRDIAFTTSRDGGQTFSPQVRVSQDQWELDGCPDDGPALALDGKNVVHVAWPTLVPDGPNRQPSIGIFYAKSADARTFTPRERLNTEGLPHHPQVLVSGDRVFVAWDELQQGKRRIVVAQRSLTSSAAGFVRKVVNGNEPGLYPAMAATPAGALVVWSSGGGDKGEIRMAQAN